MLFLVFIHLHRICWELDIKGVKPEDKLLDWHLFYWSSVLGWSSMTLMSLWSLACCVPTCGQGKRWSFTPEILSLFSLEAICLKHSSPLTSTQVYYITEIRIGFKFPLQFLTCCCGFIVIVVAEVVSYTQIHLNFNSNPCCLFFWVFLKNILFYIHILNCPKLVCETFFFFYFNMWA